MDMMNGTMEEPAEEVSDDGRRKLMQLEGLQETAMNVADKAKDVAMNVGQKVNETVSSLGDALNATATRVNETVQSGLDRVNDFVEGIQGGADNAKDNSTMMNDTMMNDTMDMIDGTMEEPTEEVSDDGRRKLMEMMDEIANATDAMMNDTMMNGTMMNGTMNATEEEHDHEGEEVAEEATGEGRRKLMDVMDAAADAVDAVMNSTMMNDTMMNGTMMNGTMDMMNGTMDMMNGTMEEAAEEATGEGRRKLMDIMSGIRRLAMLQ